MVLHLQFICSKWNLCTSLNCPSPFPPSHSCVYRQMACSPSRGNFGGAERGPMLFYAPILSSRSLSLSRQSPPCPSTASSQRHTSKRRSKRAWHFHDHPAHFDAANTREYIYYRHHVFERPAAASSRTAAELWLDPIDCLHGTLLLELPQQA
jgi:hypothetical protein